MRKGRKACKTKVVTKMPSGKRIKTVKRKK